MSVAILLTTYNGDKYLKEQLDSFIAQTYEDWVLWVSDDGSSDQSLSILQEYQDKLGKDKLKICFGPRLGYAANFLSLVCLTEINAEYFAYSDQDDIWDNEKLERAVNKISKAKKPCLYCSRTRIVDLNGRYLHDSTLFKKPTSFANALVQSIAGGNTMLLNKDAVSLMRSFGKDVKIVAHDWWTYLVISGAGGEVYYDAEPTMSYRQHGNNIIGTNLGLRAKIYRIMRLFDGHFKDWLDINLNALSSFSNLLSQDNQEILRKFLIARQSSLLKRSWLIASIGIYRQTLLGNLGIIVAVILRKL